jgi:penicillin-binding protein 2
MEDNKKYIIQFVIILVGLIYTIKLFQIQFLDTTYGPAAEDNILRKVRDYSYRGIIYDRNGNILVHNDPVFDLMVIPKEAKVPDTAQFCKLLGITREDFLQRMETARDFDIYQPSVFMKMLSIRDFGKFQDHLVDYTGFYPQVRSLRGYSHESLANTLGYVGEISRPQLQRDTAGYYRQGDYIGITGLEQQYEPDLKGENGVKYLMVNVRGVAKGSFDDGLRDSIPVPGVNLTATIDLELQQYGEWLMEDLAGGVVALEPKSGEVLSIITSPSYSPGALSGRLFSSNFSELTADSLKPLFNRAIMSVYPPGSTFKPLQALDCHAGRRDRARGAAFTAVARSWAIMPHLATTMFIGPLKNHRITISTLFFVELSTRVWTKTPLSTQSWDWKNGAIISISLAWGIPWALIFQMKKGGRFLLRRSTTEFTGKTDGSGQPLTQLALARGRF